MDKTIADRTNYKEYKMDEQELLKARKINPLHYIQLKEQGYADSEIANLWEMETTKLIQKKDHWNFIGLKPSSMKQILNKKTTKVQREQMQQAIDEELPADEKTELDTQPEEEITADKITSTETVSVSEMKDDSEEAGPGSADQELQKTINELKEQIQTLTQENTDLDDENRKLSQAKEGISQDYEKLQEEHEELIQQYKDVEYQLQNAQQKQTDYLLEEKLTETYRELEAAQQECKEYAEANQKLQMEKEAWTNRYIDEKQRHETLSSYAKQLMPS